MKAWLAAAALAVSLCATPALAQRTGTDLSGAWAFHSADYSTAPGISVRMSGYVQIRRARGLGRYQIDLFTQEVATRGQQYQETWSRQRCDGRSSEDRLTITCTLLDAGAEGYQADNFQLSRQADGTLTGHLVSSNSSVVVFRRVP